MGKAVPTAGEADVQLADCAEGVLKYGCYPASQAGAAATSAVVPVSSVGWITGAKRGEWLTGMSLPTRSSASALR